MSQRGCEKHCRGMLKRKIGKQCCNQKIAAQGLFSNRIIMPTSRVKNTNNIKNRLAQLKVEIKRKRSDLGVCLSLPKA